MIRMRDKNLNLKQFNIQLEKSIQRKLKNETLLRTPVFVSPTRQILDDQEFKIIYPRNFRLIRALVILQWYLPENLHWRIYLDLQERSFSNYNRKQQIEIAIFLSSKKNMELYLFRTSRYTGGEIFGNILGNDLSDLCKILKISKKRKSNPIYPIRRRGYKDKGAMRPFHSWLPKEDYDLTRIQLRKEKEKYLLQKTINFILSLIQEEL